MSILINEDTRLLVQGITGREGTFHTLQMVDYGTRVVAGTGPGRGGKSVGGVPVFDTVKEAMAACNPNVSIIYIPAFAAPDAILEAVDGGIPLVVCITEGIPVLDMVRVCYAVKERGARLIGANCPGVITPGEAKVGIMPGHIFKKGVVGLVSRSGTLTYEVVKALDEHGVGQSTCVGIGGDPIIGSGFIDILQLFENDPQTKAIVMIGEIGGTEEEEAAEYIKGHVTKPVVAFVAGLTAPEGKRMGHAGAIISGGAGAAADKIRALTSAGVEIAATPYDAGRRMAEITAKRDQ